MTVPAVVDVGRRIVLYEVPLPSSRTLRISGTLTAAGLDVRAVHHPRYAERIRQMGLGSVPADLAREPGPIARVQRRLRDAEAARDAARIALWSAVLEHPVPALTPRPGDIDVLLGQWLAAAEAMAATPAAVYWAADLDALPAAAWAAAANPGSRLVLDAHELFPELDYLDDLQRPEWARIARALVPQVDLVLTVGDEMAGRWREDFGARRVEVVGNLAPVPSPSTTTLRRHLGLDDGVPLAVHIGNIVANRRPELAIPLLQDVPELHVAFVGEPRQGQDEVLADLAAAAGVQNRLHLVPPVPTAELEAFVADADLSLILYSPARSVHLAVTMPNKLYDSLAAGLPVVATAGLAPARFVEEHALGVSYRDDDAASLAAAVRRVLDDDAMRDRVAHARAEARWPTIEAGLLAVVEEVLTQAGPAAARSTAPAPAPSSQVPAARRPQRGRQRTARVLRGVARRLRRLADRITR